ncbi:hypothetical protein CB1_000233029 [Camelus ferus]|nr:hypothetical protein CB1_000233029 [Camelus ferus]
MKQMRQKIPSNGYHVTWQLGPGLRGRYSAIKLGQYEDSDSVTCSVQHNEQIFNSTDLELKKTVSVTPKPKASENNNQTSKTCYEPQAAPATATPPPPPCGRRALLLAPQQSRSFFLLRKPK